MRFAEFNNAFNTEKRRIQREGVEAVGSAEERLRAMLTELDNDDDRQVGGQLIGRFPRYAVPADPPNQSMREALEIERAVYQATGTTEGRIAIIAEARRKIFEIADRADADEAPAVRGLTTDPPPQQPH